MESEFSTFLTSPVMGQQQGLLLLHRRQVKASLYFFFYHLCSLSTLWPSQSTEDILYAFSSRNHSCLNFQNPGWLHTITFAPSFFLFWNHLIEAIQFHSSLRGSKLGMHHHLMSSPIPTYDLFYAHESNQLKPLTCSLLHFLPSSFLSWSLFALCPTETSLSICSHFTHCPVTLPWDQILYFNQKLCENYHFRVIIQTRICV